MKILSYFFFIFFIYISVLNKDISKYSIFYSLFYFSNGLHISFIVSSTNSFCFIILFAHFFTLLIIYLSYSSVTNFYIYFYKKCKSDETEGEAIIKVTRSMKFVYLGLIPLYLLLCKWVRGHE